MSAEDFSEVADRGRAGGAKYQEDAGVDVVSDGERASADNFPTLSWADQCSRA
jgi:methionine synthase II (cobalamin-independent)